MKKKKTVHMRRVRRRSENKFKKFSILNFKHVFDLFFNKKFKKKSISFTSFLLCFVFINIKRVYKMLKVFGLNNKYILKQGLILNFDIFLFIFKKNYLFLQDKTDDRLLNVLRKKKLFLHVSYRHILSLPVRGQRTKTNAKTRKHFGII